MILYSNNEYTTEIKNNTVYNCSTANEILSYTLIETCALYICWKLKNCYKISQRILKLIDKLCSWIGWLITVKLSILPIWSMGLKQFSSKKKKKNAPRFFVVIYKVILKLVLKIKDSRTPKTILTKKIRVRIIQPEIKAYYIGTLIKIVWYD